MFTTKAEFNANSSTIAILHFIGDGNRGARGAMAPVKFEASP